MKIAVPKEVVPGENRVALVPDVVARMVKSNLEVIVEEGSVAYGLDVPVVAGGASSAAAPPDSTSIR